MSYKLSDAYFSAQQNKEPLIVLVAITTTAGTYIYFNRDMEQANIPSGVIVDMKAALIGLDGLTETLMSNVTDIYANYTSTEQTQAQITLDDHDKYFSFFLSTDTFMGGSILIKIGYPSIAYADMLTLFSGTVDTEALSDGQLQIQATADGSILRQSHITGRASRYARPKNPDDVLPIVYGAHYDLVRGRGLWTCPCIDTTNQYYLVADHAVLSTANGNNIKVYVNDTLKTTGYTFTPSGTDENGKTIAYLTFSPALADSDTVTVQTQGKIDGSGLLIQHPLAIIQDIVTYAGGTIADFDAYNWAAEYAYATSKNLMAAGILTHQSRLVQELVLEILGSFLASTWVSGQDDVKISFLRESASQSDVMLILSEATCSEYQTERMAANICNASTFDLVKDTAHDGVLYPNYTPFTVDCDATAGAGMVVETLTDQSMTANDTSGYGHLWFVSAGAVVHRSYGPFSGWSICGYHQQADGTRKRILWRHTDGRGIVYVLNNDGTHNSSINYAAETSLTFRDYWHDGTTGRILKTHTDGTSRLWTINSSETQTSIKTYTAITNWTPLSYSRAMTNRGRLCWQRNDGLMAVWVLDASDNQYGSIVYLTTQAGYNVTHYWHNGTQGRITLNNGTANIYRYVDCNDADVEYLLASRSGYTRPLLSQSRYGVMVRAFDGGWMQDTTTPLNIQRALYNQFSQPRWIVGFTTTDLRAQQLERGDLIAYSCDQLRDENALPLVNQIGRILELTRDPIAGTCQIKVLDTGAYMQISGVRDRTRY